MEPYDYDSRLLIPRSLIPAFDQLQESLKELVNLRLIQDDKISFEVAILALDIISRYPKSDASSQKLTERFFIHFINQVNSQVKATLDKVLAIAKEGFLEALLHTVDTKKITYHPHSEIMRIVNEFHAQTLPVLRKQEQHKVTKVDQRQDTSFIMQAYENLMKCRCYFALPSLVKSFLECLPVFQKWKQETYSFLFSLLDLQYSLKFTDIEKLNLLKAIFRLHSPLQNKSFGYCSDIDMSEFVTFCFQLKHTGGEELLDDYFTALKTCNEPSIDDMIRVLRLLLSQLDKNGFFTSINKWKKANGDWEQLIALLETHLVAAGLNEEFFKDDIDKRLERFKHDLTVEQPLSQEDLALIKRQYLTVDQLCKQMGHLGFNQLVNRAHEIRQLAKKEAIKEDDRLLLVAIGRLLIRLQFGIYPYSTQILVVLAILARGNNRQAQVKTGEGKSTINAILSFISAMECRAVDNITSARYLARRDYEKYAPFFKRCGITAGHICLDDKKPQHFKAQILYAPAFDFEFAWMEDLLWGKKLYQQRLANPYVSRNFDVAIVDESDNLLIDTVQNGARLGSPAEFSYDWIYAPILVFVRQNKSLVKQDVEKAAEELRKYLSAYVAEQHQKACQQLPKEQLKIWLKSAHQTLYKLKKETQYVINSQIDEEGNQKRVIQIVDLLTGRISENSRWQNGIHEFLEVKHDIIVQKESLTPITLSHAVFYRFYKNIIALTGTAERWQTKQIYEIETFDVPPHLPLRRIDFPTLITKDTASFYQLIIQQTKEFIAARRPILILCPTIGHTKLLEKQMQNAGIPFKLLNEVQEEREEVILSQAGGAGKVTIATATAGRGTDIILSQESVVHGGLHVLPTYRFKSKRDRNQAIGRAGRQGQPGSSQLILNREDPEIQELIKKQGRDLSDQEIIELLAKQMEVEEKSQARLHVAYAELERFLAEKTHLFFESFRAWADIIEQDALLESFAEKLSPIKLRDRKVFNFDHLSAADLPLAKECIDLLIEKSEVMAWKIFFKKVSERMKQKLIHDWVKNFFKPAEDQLKKSGLMISQLKAKIEEFLKSQEGLATQESDALLHLIANQGFEAFDQSIQTIKHEISQKFQTSMVKWEKYLDKDGAGLFVYLEEISTMNLLRVLFKTKKIDMSRR